MYYQIRLPATGVFARLEAGAPTSGVLEQVTQIGTKSGFLRDKLLMGLKKSAYYGEVCLAREHCVTVCDLCFGTRLALSRFLCTFAAGLLLCPQTW